MHNDILITVATFFIIALLFTIITITLNKSINYLTRVVFLLKTEYEYRKEEQEVRMVLSAMEDEEL